ncbi:hypothetical protein [Umezakia ovalisporum]|uniref:Uncharacterized protein n=2 Tax=Umezakia ovalisporum TaxID=75695 RepID=A0AA43GZU4_9CYAN|nr:hypothetical protein [Umezakia ovalisporum]MDH6056552.1 hypothetical protein [Umezakia ovalisporum FSS-43]MDH6064070.1 hypothetical protein [Umezakia ovalisporum FSS-62]MDH6076184.1 hypothetical protein [Umezakia ovalisporum CS-1034]MDH6077306.1 hypothetical protein [Umezakia ovalisporum FSS-45]MDH6080852.1 hypothetical protein [Umezakia ovalisporum FSS-44]
MYSPRPKLIVVLNFTIINFLGGISPAKFYGVDPGVGVGVALSVGSPPGVGVAGVTSG